MRTKRVGGGGDLVRGRLNVGFSIDAAKELSRAIWQILLTSLSTLANDPPPVDRCRFKGLAPVACLAAAAVVAAAAAAAVSGAELPPADVAVGATGWTTSGLRRIPKMSPSPSMIAGGVSPCLSLGWVAACAVYRLAAAPV